MGSRTRFRGGTWYRRVNAPLWAALACTLLCALLFLGHKAGSLTLPGLDAWERSTSDMRFRLRGTRAPLSDRIVIVALDNETRRGAPELWQTRRGFAELITKISAAKPRAFGIDAFFASPEINLSGEAVRAVREARATLETETSSSPAATLAERALALVDEETRGDDVLAKAVSGADTLVLALLFYLDGAATPAGTGEPPGVGKARLDEAVQIEQPAGRRPPRASGTVAPLPNIGTEVAFMGHVNVKHDADGAVREAPLIIERAGQLYQSMALKLASMETGEPSSYVAGEDFVSLGTRRFLVSPRTFALVSYLGANRSFPRVSALEVMNREGPHPALADKIVLLGYTDAARDKIITPFDQQLDGVELHATLVHNLLHDELLRRPSPWFGLVAVLIMGLALSLLQLRRVRGRGAWVSGVGALLFAAAYAALAQYLFSRQALQVDLVMPALSVIAITLTAMTVSLATEGREKAQLRSAFGQYMQATLVEKILQDPERLRLGGQRRELSVLFSDIRSFSRFSELLEPELLSDFLNEYLTPMTHLVMDELGTLDKYIGDAVMAVYGAPIEMEDHAERACGTALAMLEALGPLNERWRARKLPEIKIGIGINTGPMSVGNMGSESRFDYTVMGDAVNLGARLESLTKAYGVSILVGEATMRAAEKSYVFREIDWVRVLGREAAAPVYELCGRAGASPFSPEDLQLFARALAAYRERDWAAASEHLEDFGKAHPTDGPCATLAERIAVLEATPPPEDWDGIFAQSSK